MSLDEELDHSLDIPHLQKDTLLSDASNLKTVLAAYAPNQDYLTETYAAYFSSYIRNSTFANEKLDLFSVRLTNNTIDRMVYCNDPQLFNKGMITILELSLEGIFDQFHDLTSYIAAHRQLIQREIYQDFIDYRQQLNGILFQAPFEDIDLLYLLSKNFSVPFEIAYSVLEKAINNNLLGHNKPELMHKFLQSKLQLEDMRQYMHKEMTSIRLHKFITDISMASHLDEKSSLRLILPLFNGYKRNLISNLNNQLEMISSLENNSTVAHLDHVRQAFSEAKIRVEKNELIIDQEIEDFILRYHPETKMFEERLRHDRPKGFALPRTLQFTTGFNFYYKDYQNKINHATNRQNYRQALKIDKTSIDLTVTNIEKNKWEHTHPEHYSKCSQLLEITYQKVNSILSTTSDITHEDKATVLAMTAKIHWLFANMMPYERGSAAIGHMIAAHLMTRAGIEFSRVKPGICIDIDSFLMPLDDFIKAYPSFFEYVSLTSNKRNA